MAGTYSLGMVFLSLAVAILASYTALDLAKRISTIQTPRHRQYWLAGGAVSMGLGIWSMHFMGMLAFSMPIPLGYDVWITLLSLGIAILVSGLALYSATRKVLTLNRLVLSGILMGVGISAMHYTGMEAMRMSPRITYVPWIFAASVVIAISASVAAMWIAFTLRTDDHKFALPRKLAAATVMGFAITGMHYTGMAAAHFAPSCVSRAAQTNLNWLAVTIGGLTFCILITTLLLSVLDSRLESRTNLYAKSLNSANDQLIHLATHDVLTDLPNRLVLCERIQHAIHVSLRSGKSFAVLYIDLDGFKVVNDSLGHQTGDAVLKQAAERLQGVLRKEDTLSRIGGDEFAAVVDDLQAIDAMTVCEQINESLRRPFKTARSELNISSSIGIAIFPSDGDTVETLLQNADAAMYEVKRSGRNGYRYFEPAMHTNALRALSIQAELRHALKEGGLYLHYQPKFAGPELELVGTEALIRWNHPELGQVSPGEFVPLAERSGLILEVGEWVIREVCRQLRSWIDQGVTPLKIAINLSAKHLRQRDLLNELTMTTQEFTIDPRLLMLEITESAAMEDAESNVATINELQTHGFDVAIDDFGTGYSSLSYLQQFRVRQVKIDRFFVNGLERDTEESTAIVSAVIALAHALNMEVVAEGVETENQLNALKDLSCDQFQGFFLDRPMPADAFTGLLITRMEPEGRRHYKQYAEYQRKIRKA